LDILLFGDHIINLPDLTVPHPQMHLRSFVLNCLCEIDSEIIHPTLKVSIKRLKERLNNADFVIESDRPQLISIAGLIGVGKTTLTKKLSNKLNCDLLFEPYDTNPFMPKVYGGNEELALDSELYFLTSRSEQLAPNLLKPNQIYISDYILDKSLIYAKIWLDSDQLQLYEKIYLPLIKYLIKPTLVIYLTDSIENCMERIHDRKRPYEQKIQKQFLQKLEDSYKKLFTDWKISPVIKISIPKFNCYDDSDIDKLVNQIKYYIAL